MDLKHEVANLTLAQATTHAPFVTYARCVDASSQPYNHVGDWPEEGKLYPVRAVTSKLEGIDLVHVLGFEGQAPYFNAFGPHRFRPVIDIWLN